MIYLIGASGHAKVVIEILELQGEVIGGLLEVNRDVIELLEYKTSQALPETFDIEVDKVFIAIGNNTIRNRLTESFQYQYCSAIHPRANVSRRANIGIGTVIMSGVSINASVEIGNHVIINTNASIDHDCVIHDFVHVSPNVALAGDVEIGVGSHIGIGACIIQGIRIGKWCTVGAGTVILSNVPDGATVVGNPGRIIKINNS